MMDRTFPIPLHGKERIVSALTGLGSPAGFSMLLFIDFEIPQLLILFAPIIRHAMLALNTMSL